MSYSIEELNQLAPEQFVKSVGWVFEHSPWVAERASQRRPFESLAQMHARMCAEVEAGSREEQLALLRAHPDLGTRARISPSSASEQAGAGLDQLTAAEYERLVDLNEAYKEKFGFPFLYAVKGSDKTAILRTLGKRLHAKSEDEFREALKQVFRIAAFRLESVVD
jgi:2-oxo-4-hydroxy-4-carboxy-5-ureidoimidazoline decarboxylase